MQTRRRGRLFANVLLGSGLMGYQKCAEWMEGTDVRKLPASAV
jgi:hypothetical protein